MRLSSTVRLLAATFLFLAASACSAEPQAEVVSSMRNVNAVPEAFGYRLSPAYDAAAEMGPEDLAPVQAFEIIRPDDGPVTIGRLYTSCTCIQLQSPRRNFPAGERAVLQLRNIKATPFNGQVYAIYVQITSPVRTTLRFDTFVQSRNVSLPDPPAPGEEQPAAADVLTAEADDIPDAASDGAASDDSIELIVPSAASAAASAAGVAVESAEQAVADAAAEAKSEVDAAREEMDAHFADQAGAASVSGAVPPPASPAASETVHAAPPSDPLAASLDAILADMDDEEYPTLMMSPDQDALGAPRIGTQAPAAGSVRPPAPAPEPALVSEPEALARPEPIPVPAAAPEAIPVPVAAPAAAASHISASETAKPLETVSLITIGARDMARSTRFYEELGWRRASRNKYDQTVFFQLNGQVLVLYPLPELLKEQNMADAAPSPGGITLAIHVRNKADVASTYESFMRAGGASLKEPAEMPSGAVTCYVADPDGNPWEISWVPQFRVDDDGKLWLP